MARRWRPSTWEAKTRSNCCPRRFDGGCWPKDCEQGEENAAGSEEAREARAFRRAVQLDGNFHEWLEGRGPRGCLMNLVDDAPSTTLRRMGEQETIWAAVGVLEAWIEKYGVPRALYADWKNVYVREPTAKEQLHGITAVTQFGRMCERLGIRIIAAGPSEAKGRVERSHGTHQDR